MSEVVVYECELDLSKAITYPKAPEGKKRMVVMVKEIGFSDRVM